MKRFSRWIEGINHIVSFGETLVICFEIPAGIRVSHRPTANTIPFSLLSQTQPVAFLKHAGAPSTRTAPATSPAHSYTQQRRCT